eukprot:COSAG02_NODE_53144_length_303_cov_1.264706_1_plen_73_part_01
MDVVQIMVGLRTCPAACIEELECPRVSSDTLSRLLWRFIRIGPINTWDRQAFFTDIPSPASFDPAPTQITGNF